MRVASRSRPMCQRQSGSSMPGARLDPGLDLQQMPEPAFDDACEGVGRRLLEAEVDDRVEAVRARPVDLPCCPRPARRGPPTSCGVPVSASSWPRPVSLPVRACISTISSSASISRPSSVEALCSRKNSSAARSRIGSAQSARMLRRIRCTIWSMNTGRNGDARLAHQPQVRALDGAGAHQHVAVGQHHPVVIRGLGVGERREARRLDRAQRVGHQRLVQPHLRRARGLDRVHLGPRVVGAQEWRRDLQPALGAALQQVHAGRFPEVAASHRPPSRSWHAAARRSAGGWCGTPP